MAQQPDSPSPYVIVARGPLGIRKEVGVNIWSAAGWADSFRSAGYRVSISQGGAAISYRELMRREVVETAGAYRRFARPPGNEPMAEGTAL